MNNATTMTRPMSTTTAQGHSILVVVDRHGNESTRRVANSTLQSRIRRVTRAGHSVVRVMSA